MNSQAMREAYLTPRPKMNDYAQISKRLIDKAETDDNIRAIIQIGSRARSVEPADEWSDLDLVIIAEKPSAYTQNNAWIYKCGTPLLMFTEHAFDGSVERRVLFEGFLDVDFVFDTPESFSQSLKSEAVQSIFQRGYKVLLDKDTWQMALDEQHYAPATPHEVSDEEILNEIHDYWYHCVWTIKKIRRGELWTAMNCLNWYMKGKLLHMIEIVTRATHDEDVDTWHNGKLLERWAAPSIVQRLHGCFADYDARALLEALRRQIDLYHDLASEIARQRGIPYPEESRVKIIEWITNMGR